MSSGPLPSVSVVVAARNAEAFVEEAVRSALDQTVPPSQIVVVDDGSTDATAAIAEGLDPRVTVLRREHAGAGPSRNAGIDVADGLFLALLDADDVWLPTKLELQLEAFAADPTREAVFTWFDEFVDPEHPPPPGIREPRTGQSASLSTGVLLPRAIVDRIGPFGEGAHADWMAWWTRARSLGVVEHVVPEVLYRRRIHSSNNSFVHGDQGATFMAVAREHLRVRREQAAAHEES